MAVRKKKRKFRSAKSVEEVRVGAATTDWTDVVVTDSLVRQNLNHYHYFSTSKDYIAWTNTWAKSNLSKEDYAAFRKAESWKAGATLGFLCKMMLDGATFGEKRMQWILDNFDRVIQRGKLKIAERTVDVPKQKKNVQDFIAEKTHKLICELEEVLDLWEDNLEFDFYTFLRSNDCSLKNARGILKFYLPIHAEYEAAVKPKNKELFESYSAYSKKKLRSKRDFIKRLIDDCEKFETAKKVSRKPRVSKVKKGKKIDLSNVQFLKANDEYKLQSNMPEKIIGAREVWLFNQRYRTLSILIAEDTFTIKGTTIQGLDDSKSSSKKLRKPNEFFDAVQKTTKIRGRKIFESLKTKAQATTGRLGKDTLILKVYK